jgi:hypothetical protein
MKNLLTFSEFINEAKVPKQYVKNDKNKIEKIKIDDLNKILANYSEIGGPIGKFGFGHLNGYSVGVSMISVSNFNVVEKLKAEIIELLQKEYDIHGVDFTEVKSPQSTPRWKEAIEYKKTNKLRGKLMEFSFSIYNEDWKW